ncbi:hypothetical protein BBJ28_00003458 [Nothophytophthora sp. Chile5]|nr:hypothetical protein BBJ28_00003458 [Nothophytophthora sp. Chile5]
MASAATDLVAYVNKLLPGSALDFSVEIKKNELAPVAAAVVPKAAQLLALEAETDVEGAFNLLFAVVLQLPTDQALAEAQKLLATITGASEDSAIPSLAVASASNLFNKATALPALRLQTLLQVVELAGKSGNVELVSGYLDSAESLLDAKTLTVADRRQLHLTIANVLETSEPPATSLKVLAVLEKYLATFAQVSDAKELATGKAVAERAAKLMLQNPVASFLARVDLVASPVVAATLKPGKLYELLDIVSTKTLAEFTAFQKSAGSVFADNALDETELADTMRLFTLCSLPTGFKEIPYADVAAALAVAEEDVEKWVVRAITSGLVSAKIDQLRRTVVISRSLERGFGPEQWQEIDAKLQLYKKNVGGLLDIIRNARRAQEQQ